MKIKTIKSVRLSDPTRYSPRDKNIPGSPFYENRPVVYRSRNGSEVNVDENGDIKNYDLKQKDVLMAIDGNEKILMDMENVAEIALQEKFKLDNIIPKLFNFSYMGASFSCSLGAPLKYNVPELIKSKEVLVYYGLESYSIVDRDTFDRFALGVIDYEKWNADELV